MTLLEELRVLVETGVVIEDVSQFESGCSREGKLEGTL